MSYVHVNSKNFLLIRLCLPAIWKKMIIEMIIIRWILLRLSGNNVTLVFTWLLSTLFEFILNDFPKLAIWIKAEEDEEIFLPGQCQMCYQSVLGHPLIPPSIGDSHASRHSLMHLWGNYYARTLWDKYSYIYIGLNTCF